MIRPDLSIDLGSHTDLDIGLFDLSEENLSNKIGENPLNFYDSTNYLSPTKSETNLFNMTLSTPDIGNNTNPFLNRNSNNQAITPQKMPMERQNSALNLVLSVIKQDDLQSSRTSTGFNNFGGDVEDADIASLVGYLQNSGQSSPMSPFTALVNHPLTIKPDELSIKLPISNTVPHGVQVQDVSRQSQSNNFNTVPVLESDHTYTNLGDSTASTPSVPSPVQQEEVALAPVPVVNYSWTPNTIAPNSQRQQFSARLIKSEPTSVRDSYLAIPVSTRKYNTRVKGIASRASRPSSVNPFTPAFTPDRPESAISMPDNVEMMEEEEEDDDDELRDVDVKDLKNLPPARRYSRRKPLDKANPTEFDEWRRRRDRNNDAVRRARAKKKDRDQQMEQACDVLTRENSELKTKLTQALNEVKTLKELLAKQRSVGRTEKRK